MIAYIDAYELLGNESLQKRVLYARLHTAAFILIEDPQAPNHANRVDWANKAFKETLQMPLRQLLLYVITDANVAANGQNATDAQIQGAVDALLSNMIAGG